MRTLGKPGPADEAESIATMVWVTKFGSMRDPRGNWLGSDGRPVAVRNSLPYSLQRLGTDHVDIDRFGRVDPNIPTEETIGARRRDHLKEALGALQLRLEADDLASIERSILPGSATGDRYAAPVMATLDSERPGTSTAH